jgi:hypothetical protein
MEHCTLCFEIDNLGFRVENRSRAYIFKAFHLEQVFSIDCCDMQRTIMPRVGYRLSRRGFLVSMQPEKEPKTTAFRWPACFDCARPG